MQTPDCLQSGRQVLLRWMRYWHLKNEGMLKHKVLCVQKINDLLANKVLLALSLLLSAEDLQHRGKLPYLLDETEQVNSCYKHLRTYLSLQMHR